jgi:sulfur relay (sulfurtransferase) complex TusBCD TusD component (DsrE family)
MPVQRFGILLSTPPSHPSVETVFELSAEALSQGFGMYLYFIDEGVKNLEEARVHKLVSRGLKLFVCAYGCQQHVVATDTLDQRISLCGLVILTNIIKGCGRFLAFT